MKDHLESSEQVAALLHELRQPLNMIMLSCQNLKNRHDLNDADTDKKYLFNKIDRIESSVVKAAQITEKIESIFR